MSSLLALLIVFICWLAGRLAISKPMAPLIPAVAGVGIWYVVWLLGTLAGIQGQLLAAGFGAAILVGTLALKRNFQPEIPYLKSSAIFLGLLFPSLALLNSDLVLRWDEISHLMRNADILRILGHLPTHSDVINYEWLYPEFPLAFTALGLPAQWIMAEWTPAIYACFNLIFLALAADATYRLFVRKDNLDYSAIACIILALGVINPFVNRTILASGYIDPMLAVALFAAALPLLSKAPLPRDARDLIPYSLAWVCVIGLKEIGLFLMVIALGLWGLRLVWEGRTNLRTTLLQTAVQLAILAIPAILIMLVWKGWVSTLNIPKVWDASQSFTNIHFERFGDTSLNMFKGWWGRPDAFILLSGFLIALVVMLRRRTFNPVITTPLLMAAGYSAIIFFIFVTIFPDGMGRSAHSYWRYMGHIQYFMLAGFSLWLIIGLNRLAPAKQKRVTYTLISLIIVGQAFITPVLQPEPNKNLREAKAVADAWKNIQLPPFTCLPKGFETEHMEMLRYELRMRTIMQRCDTPSA